ncbi:DNA-protecting protein DprA [Ancylomarina salipaludis]|uniref:DNA-protecting protein DprA n=1 Tax=Ancylomarina salipaludis TaxID=2501299 RepID=A0A4V1MZU8_9BACT|nr:DNA-processing protein DprA [Ancylomarina salipaludis]RXQ89814.1 DNA-protecting protein DprA [Ancylomarina salipaludis]
METLYKVAFSFLNGLGSINARKVIAYTGGVDGFFRVKKQELLKVPGIGKHIIQKLDRDAALREAEAELKFINDNDIKVAFYLDENFPQRLLNCSDSPTTLYYKGEINFNASRILSVVGTRNATEYGKENCRKIIKALASHSEKTIIVSGLAYGIDICAHKAALKYKLPTVAVVGHGFHMMYPAQHRKYAEEIIHQGGLVSEFTSQSVIDPRHFVRRNRIIAGMADATLIVESAKKGGALITAEIANSYNRDVLAFPGRPGDVYSKGCNHLIKTNQAHLIESVADLEYILGWENDLSQKDAVQSKMFVELSPEEDFIVSLLRDEGKLGIDILSVKSNLPMSRVSSLLLKMEFEGLVRALPGKIYALTS